MVSIENVFAKLWSGKSVHMMRHTFVYIHVFLDPLPQSYSHRVWNIALIFIQVWARNQVTRRSRKSLSRKGLVLHSDSYVDILLQVLLLPTYTIFTAPVSKSRRTLPPRTPSPISSPVIRIDRHYVSKNQSFALAPTTTQLPTRTFKGGGKKRKKEKKKQPTIFMAEIAKPITSLFFPRPVRSAPQIHPDLQVLLGQDLRRAALVHGLRLPVDDEFERRAGGPVVVVIGDDGHEADGRPGGDDGVRGGETVRVADGAEDAAPVGVLAVQGRLDQGVPRDGRGDEPGVRVGGRVCDSDADELRRALAVAHDELRELLREVREDLLHGDAVVRGGRGDGVAGGGGGGGAVGEDGEGVVCAGAAVYADGVEGALDGVGEEGLEGGGGDGGVGAEDAEEGGHVGVDHAGAFGHSGYGVGDVWGRGEGEGLGEEFGEGVGRTDCSSGRQP